MTTDRPTFLLPVPFQLSTACSYIAVSFLFFCCYLNCFVTDPTPTPPTPPPHSNIFFSPTGTSFIGVCCPRPVYSSTTNLHADNLSPLCSHFPSSHFLLEFPSKYFSSSSLTYGMFSSAFIMNHDKHMYVHQKKGRQGISAA
jgi:hypothetical protein